MKETEQYQLKLISVVIVVVLIFYFFIAIGTHDYSNSNKEIKYCRIDSITAKPRYEVMPQLDYTYWTDCGAFPAGNSKHQVGDSIEIKIITIK